MPQLSATTLKLFQECPRCFWVHVNQKVERPRGPFPSLPSGIDRVLRAYFDGYRTQGGLPPLLEGRLAGTLSTHPLNLGFNDPATGARLWGKLDDCVILPDRRLCPLDHKTRASAPDDVSYTLQYYKFQMDVYTLLLERNGHPTSRTAYVIYYFPLNGVLHDGFPFGIAIHEIETHPDEAYRVFAAACACLAGELPPPAPACAYCQWAAARAALGTAPPAFGQPPSPAKGRKRSSGPLAAPAAGDLFAP
jgi:hypothetical protein